MQLKHETLQLIERLKKKLEHISDMYGCKVAYDGLYKEDVILYENDANTGEKKWLIAFHLKGEEGLSIRSFGLGYFDHHIRNFPWTDIDKDIVDLTKFNVADSLMALKRSEVNLISDKTIDVIKLVIEKEADGLHVELIESRDRTDFSLILSDYFQCPLPEIDEDGYQHFLLKQEGNNWRVSTPVMGQWTAQSLYNAFLIDYSYDDQLLHMTFYNKDAQLVQQSNMFIRSITIEEDGLLFNSVKRNKKIKLVIDDRISMFVTY